MLSTTQLDLSHIDQISQLLNRVWPTLYGPSGCPVFSTEYLGWLYGGPNAARNTLLGAFRGDELVGFKANLFRPLAQDGSQWTAALTTHLAIDSTLDLASRGLLAMELSRLPIEEDNQSADACQISFAYFEADKPLSKSVKILHKERGIKTVDGIITQAVFNPLIASRFLGESRAEVRHADAADAGDIHSLLRDRSAGLIRLDLDPDALWYHLSNAPDADVLVSTEGGKITGVAASYRLDWLKAGQNSVMTVVEMAIAEDTRSLASLLLTIAETAKLAGSRGVIVENPSHLTEEVTREVGLMPSPRKMSVELRTYQDLPRLDAGFLCDVK